MDLGTVLVLVLLVILGVNQYVTRTRWIGVAGVFWGMQALNALFVVAVVVSPLPGLDRIPAVKVVIGMMFGLRLIHNWRMRLMWAQRQENAEIEAEAEEQERLRALEATALRPRLSPPGNPSSEAPTEPMPPE